jgi:hypothetical protein
MRAKTIVGVLLLFALASVVFVPHRAAEAQSLCNSSNTVSIPTTVTGSITNAAYITFYCFEGTAGQTITVEVEATSGNLDTYLGLADETGERVFVEDDDGGEGTNSAFTYELTETRTYMIIVTRFNLDEGTSAGDFALTVSVSGGSGGLGGLGGLGGGTDPTEEPAQVTFEYPTVGDGTGSTGMTDGSIFITCDTGVEIRGGIQFSFINVNPGFSYTVTVVGLDGFDPVVAVETQPGIGTCNDDAPAAAGTRMAVPGFGNVVADRLTSQVRFTTPARGNPVNISVGSFNDSAGRFVMIIEGFVIQPRDEQDGFSVRVPQAVQTEPLGVYMIARFTDLDPYMFIGAGEGLNQAYDANGDFDWQLIDFNRVFGPLLECDNLGFAECDFAATFPTGTVDVTNGSSYAPDNRVDAGITVVPNTTDPILYFLGSSGARTSGRYAIVVTGSVPGVN